MSTGIIIALAIAALVLIVGGLFLYGACKHSSREYAPEN